MMLFAEVEKPHVKKVPDAPTIVKGADVLKEYLLSTDRSQKFTNFAKRKAK